jgi:hypothetical protein
MRRLSRRGFPIALVTFVAVALVVIFLLLEHAISHRRWPVKTLTDADRALVDRTPVDSTVAYLASLPRVPGPLPHDRRIPPHERKVYRVRARLEAVHRMLDGDFHVLISDPDDRKARMIVEVPAPGEGKTTGLSETFRRTRAALSEKGDPGRLVRVTGVGFFDYTHWQPGAAQNGFELHPVLSVEFLD